ncbi:MAG: ArnT family glycosyltransferase [Armatimonadota bacterium]
MVDLKISETDLNGRHVWLNPSRCRPGYRTTIAVLIIMAFGTVIRSINLGYPTFFMDEYDHVYAGKSINETGKPLLPSGQPYTRALPYTYMVAASFRLFGVSEASARVPSVIFGVLMILVAYVLGRAFLGTKEGLLAALLAACLVLPVEWSRACRMYTLFAFLYGLGFLSFYKGFERSVGGDRDHTLRSLDIRWLALSAALLFAAYMVQMLAGMFAVGVGAYCLVMLFAVWRRSGLRSALISKYAALLVAFAVGAVGLTVFTRVPQQMWEMARECPVYAVWKSKRYDFYVSVLFGNNFERLALLGAVMLALRGKKGAFLLTGLIVPLLVHTFFLAWKSERYILYLYPLFLVAVAIGVLTAVGWVLKITDAFARRAGASPHIRPWTARLVAVSVLVIWLLTYNSLWQGVFAYKEYHGVTMPHVDWRGVGQYLKANARPTDAIAVSVPLAVLYYAGRMPEYSVRRFEAEGRRPTQYGKVRDRYAGSLILEDERMLDDMMRRHPRGWFVVDVPRWNRYFLSQREMDLVTRRMTPHPNASDGTVLVYSWGM